MDRHLSAGCESPVYYEKFEANSPKSDFVADATDSSIYVACNGLNERPLVSVVVPAYNEEAVLWKNLGKLCRYMRRLEASYRWEVIVVNDGSSDDTGAIAEQVLEGWPSVKVVHHLVNGGLGQALQTGAKVSQGKYVITLDVDLSYSPSHIELLLKKIQETQAKVVVASPYMPGGKVSNVPRSRLWLSIWANRFLSATAKRRVSTLTGLVRAYDGDFLRSLNLLSPGMEVNPEILHKAVLLHGRIEEIPAYLCWEVQQPKAARNEPRSLQRKSSMKILRHAWSIFFFGFLFRPAMFFVLPSLGFLGVAVSLWAHIGWVYWRQVSLLQSGSAISESSVQLALLQLVPVCCLAVAALILAILLFGMGLLAVQSKRYFQELFCLGMAGGCAQPEMDRSARTSVVVPGE